MVSESVVADVGSGTGFLAELFLNNGNKVYAVEPNLEMRSAAERVLGNHPGFVSVAAAAEFTSLLAKSIDLITAAQSFHWFNNSQAKDEFRRILKPAGWLILIWNERVTSGTDFNQAYEAFISKYAQDYDRVNHANLTDKTFVDFYGHEDFKLAVMNNHQHFDLTGLQERLLSSSYMPNITHPLFDVWSKDLVGLFEEHAIDNKIQIDYFTKIYHGHLSGS